MKTILITITFFITSVFFLHATAQVSITTSQDAEQKIVSLSAKKEAVRAQEQSKLKEAVRAINEHLEKGTIGQAEAEKLKKEAAKKHAMNIQNRLDIIDSKIALLQRNGEMEEKTSLSIGLGFWDDEKEKSVVDSIPSRTISGAYIAFGLNNALSEGRSIDDSPYKIGGSRFFEVGYVFTTILLKNGFLRLKYGASLQFNGLKPEGNQYFVKNGDQTELQEYPISLDKSKFRMDNLVFPVHVELGPSSIVQGDDNAYYSTADHFKFGIGGYLGLNLNTVQKLKFKNDGHNEKVKLKDYNTVNFIYGLSAYVGYGEVALYVKYDLNPIFNDNNTELHTVSLGLILGY